MKQILSDRLKLLLTGLATGDSLGSTSEFKSQSEVPALYARLKHTGWPFAQVGGGPFGWRPGDPTDDSDMALCLVRSFAELGRFDGADVARRFVEWLRSGPPDVGGTTRRTLGAIAAGTAWHEGGLADYRRNPGNAANGSLMRNGVAAGMADDLAGAFRVSLHHGLMTHYGPLPQLCCAAQTYLAWELLAGRDPFAGDWLQALRPEWSAWLEGDADEVTAAWRRNSAAGLPAAWETIASAEWDPRAFNPFGLKFGGNDGYCVLSLQIAVWAAWWSRTEEPFPVPAGYAPEPFKQRGPWALGWVALIGHDADTYGASAGPLVAAVHGGLPEEMTRPLSALEAFRSHRGAKR